MWKAQDSGWALAQKNESNLLNREGLSQPWGGPSLPSAFGWRKLFNLSLEIRKLEPTQLITGTEK
jgi:hypothetical protein